MYKYHFSVAMIYTQLKTKYIIFFQGASIFYIHVLRSERVC